jgi:hypothetical protein
MVLLTGEFIPIKPSAATGSDAPRQGLDGSGALRLTRPWPVCHRSKRRSRRLPVPMTSQVIAGTPLGTHTQRRQSVQA